jgi:UDP-N-acetylglucosamine acyltransferase
MHDYAIIGGIVAIHQFVSIGAHSMVGGGYRVPKDICPYAMAMGYPLKIRTPNLIGLKRRGFSTEALKNIKTAFRILFHSPYNTTDAINKIKDELPNSDEINTILTFIASSRRGLVK